MDVCVCVYVCVHRNVVTLVGNWYPLTKTKKIDSFIIILKCNSNKKYIK